MNRNRALWVVGAALVFSGLAMTSFGSTAYTTIDGNRITTVNVTGDSSAYLTVLGTNAGTTPNFGNSLNTDMTVTLDSAGTGAEFDVDDNDNFQNPPVTFTLFSGQDRDVGVAADEKNITVNVSASLASGGSIELTRVFEIPQSGQVVLTPNVKDTGNSGKYEFELENNGTVNVTIDGIGINQTSETTADNVGGGNILEADGTQVMTDTIPIDSTNSATIEDFDQQLVDINTGQTVTFEFLKFRTANGKNAKMKGDTVDVTVTFTDGSQKTLELRP